MNFVHENAALISYSLILLLWLYLVELENMKSPSLQIKTDCTGKKLYALRSKVWMGEM